MKFVITPAKKIREITQHYTKNDVAKILVCFHGKTRFFYMVGESLFNDFLTSTNYDELIPTNFIRSINLDKIIKICA